ncbi:MAG TPA: Hpt domain-containing protein [Anaerolineaceae bacterium]
MIETPLNQDAWESLKTMTDPAFLVELIDVYLTDSPQLIAQMHAGLAQGDIEGVRRAAHSLKSNSLTFGANHLAGLARDLEMLAKGGTLVGAQEILPALEASYAQVVPALEELKNER